MKILNFTLETSSKIRQFLARRKTPLQVGRFHQQSAEMVELEAVRPEGIRSGMLVIAASPSNDEQSQKDGFAIEHVAKMVVSWKR